MIRKKLNFDFPNLENKKKNNLLSVSKFGTSRKNTILINFDFSDGIPHVRNTIANVAGLGI